MRQYLTPADWFETANHLTQHAPYTFKGADGPFYLKIGEALNDIPVQSRQIDPVGVMEMLTRGYPFAERTMVTGLQRAPWLAAPSGKGCWQYAHLPEHGQQVMTRDEVVKILRDRLINEALGYLEGRTRVGILLSGGLDSRVTAGILRTVQLSGDYPGDVVAFTWGLNGTRDVSYARKIAEDYGWEWRHLELGPELLRNNIHVTGEMGAEFAPFHLHAMTEVAGSADIDAIIAGSYGDSVGRAEFSGARVWELAPFVPSRPDPFGLLRDEIREHCLEGMRMDAYGYREHVHRGEEFQYREIEQQKHYMRRRNQACMSLIAERIPLYQMFTAPATFGFMWSLKAQSRTDQYYEGLLPLLPGRLAELPWARTGLPLGQAQGDTDDLAKLHHQYGVWLRRELYDEIRSLVLDGPLVEIGVFNLQTLRWLMRLWSKPRTHSINKLDEMIAWMASLAVFVGRFNIRGLETFPPQKGFSLAAIRGVSRAALYLAAREQLRT